MPAAVEDQLKIKPIYKIFPGWKTSTNGIKDMDALPENAKKYIYAVEEFIGAKVSSVSTSPERDDTIFCLLYTSPSPRDRQKSRMPSSA